MGNEKDALMHVVEFILIFVAIAVIIVTVVPGITQMAGRLGEMVKATFVSWLEPYYSWIAP